MENGFYVERAFQKRGDILRFFFRHCKTQSDFRFLPVPQSLDRKREMDLGKPRSPSVTPGKNGFVLRIGADLGAEIPGLVFPVLRLQLDLETCRQKDRSPPLASKTLL